MRYLSFWAGFTGALIFTLALCSHLGILYRDPCHPYDGWHFCR
jgi:hypothetical protein